MLSDEQMRDVLKDTNHMVRNSMHGPFWPELEQACRAIEADRAQRVPEAVCDSELMAHIRKHIDTYADKHPTLLIRQLAGVLRALLTSTPAPAQQERGPMTEQERLERELEEARKDAGRYRWLRHSCCEGYPSGEGSSSKDAYLVITGYDDLYPMTDAQKDAAIDAAIKLYKGHKPYTGQEPGRAADFTQGQSDGADLCERAIRARGKT